MRAYLFQEPPKRLVRFFNVAEIHRLNQIGCVLDSTKQRRLTGVKNGLLKEFFITPLVAFLVG